MSHEPCVKAVRGNGRKPDRDSWDAEGGSFAA